MIFAPLLFLSPLHIYNINENSQKSFTGCSTKFHILIKTFNVSETSHLFVCIGICMPQLDCIHCLSINQNVFFSFSKRIIITFWHIRTLKSLLNGIDYCRIVKKIVYISVLWSLMIFFWQLNHITFRHFSNLYFQWIFQKYNIYKYYEHYNNLKILK